jgi:hypothetical protein
MVFLVGFSGVKSATRLASPKRLREGKRDLVAEWHEGVLPFGKNRIPRKARNDGVAFSVIRRLAERATFSSVRVEEGRPGFRFPAR